MRMNELQDIRREGRSYDSKKKKQSKITHLIPKFTTPIELLPNLFFCIEDKESFNQLLAYAFIQDAQKNIIDEIIFHFFIIGFIEYRPCN